MDMDALSPKLRPWMRFHPPEDKVINFFLRAKITGNDDLVDFIPEVQSCKWEPWDLKILLDFCGIKTAYPEQWFFSPLDLKHRSGNRSNRATNAGYWKVTGKDKNIMSESELIGKKKFLVFYIWCDRGDKKGKKTNWVIHEYYTTLKQLNGTHPGQKGFVLCRLSYKHEKNIKDPIANDAQPAVSSPATSKSFIEDSREVWLTKASQNLSEPSILTESELLVDSVFPASEVHATKTPENCDGTISIPTTAAECDDKCFCALGAENQFGEFTTINDYLEIEDMINELQQIDGSDALKSSSSPHNNPTISSDTADRSSLEELQFTQGLPYLSNCNQNSYSACTARHEVPKATFSEVDFLLEDGLSLSELPLEPPDGASQKNLTLVSIKDNGSGGGPDAELANALVESTFQDSGGISKRKASSGLLNLESQMLWTGWSSNQIFQPDSIAKN